MLRVSLTRLSGEPLRQQRAPGVIPVTRLQGLSQSNPSRISQADPALAQCKLAVDCDDPGNAQVIALGHVTDAHFQFRS
jgi:hypothetical protein